MTSVVLELVDVVKDYRGLRPLRIERLTVSRGDSVALDGLDRVAAEVFVNLVTGATLPDKGEVRLFGRPTSAISDSADWLAVVDRFGIVSDRAVLLDALSVEQNLATPFTLDIDPPPDDIRQRAAALARDVGLEDDGRLGKVGELDGVLRFRVRLGRALANDPEIMLMEHPTAELPRDRVAETGRALKALVARRKLTLIAVSSDDLFTGALAGRVLVLQPASGRVVERKWGRWFRRA